MTVLEYVLYGEPLPMPRPRVGRFGVKPPSEAVRDLKSRHSEAARLAMPSGWDASAAVVVHVACYRRTRRRCDVDNLAKLPLDALTGVVWSDDSQITRLTVEKHTVREDERTEVRVWRVE